MGFSRRNGQIRIRQQRRFTHVKSLQFIQLKPENPHPTQWLFVGAYDVLDEYTENDGKILYRYNEIPEYASLKARAVVYYKRDPGYTGVVFNLSNNEERRREFSQDDDP